MGEAEWRSNWDLFDRPPKSGKLPKETVKHLMRAVGRHYLDDELDALLPDNDVTLDAYMDAMRKPYTEPECDITAAVRAYDGKDSGCLMESQYIRVITDGAGAVPEKMLEDAKFMIDFDGKGSVPIDDFVRAIECPVDGMQPTMEDILRLGA